VYFDEGGGEEGGGDSIIATITGAEDRRIATTTGMVGVAGWVVQHYRLPEGHASSGMEEEEPELESDDESMEWTPLVKVLQCLWPDEPTKKLLSLERHSIASFPFRSAQCATTTAAV
jgi:hypothetical protein